MLIIVILRELNEIKEQFFRKLKTFDLFFIKFVVKMNIHKFIDTFFPSKCDQTLLPTFQPSFTLIHLRV